MYQLTFLIVGLFLGAMAAGFAVWLSLRKSAEAAVARARNEAQLEAARATERSSLQAAQLESLKSSLAAAETKTLALQHQLDSCIIERTRFDEQANRVPALEQLVQQTAAEKQQFQHELVDSRAQLAAAQAIAAARETQVANLGEEVLNLSKKRDDAAATQARLQAQIAELTTTIDAERKQNTEKLTIFNQARDEFTATFKNLANDIFEQKTQQFTDTNKTNLAQILDPLKTRIQEFQTQVQTAYDHETRDRVALGEQVKRLMELNQQLSDDANNLAKALKGSSVELGDWGEMILEQILEGCGLQKDNQYFIQPAYVRRDGSRARPDAVVLLPDNRSLIVDSKASLSAYYEYARAETDESRAEALDEHIAAVRQHVNDLSIRDYEDLPDLNSPDFVIMFVPIEPAFILAVTRDRTLWEDAWKKNVLLVSPSSFLFVIRIVANLWTQEAQKRHYQDIADRGAALYDKLVGFVEDLKAVGEGLNRAREKYDNAFLKLREGKGNVIRQAEMLKELGVRPSKALPQDIVAQSADEPVPAATIGNGSLPPSSND